MRYAICFIILFLLSWQVSLAQEQFRSLSPFKSLTLNADVDVIYVPDQKYGVAFDFANPDQVDQVKTQTSGDGLFISYEGNTDKKKRQVYVYAPTLAGIVMSGQGSIKGQGTIRGAGLTIALTGNGDIKIPVRVDKLNVVVSGNGDVRLDGEADEASVTVSGNGNLFGQELRTLNSKLIISGQGDVDLYVKNQLNVVVSGSGKIRYWGKPNVLKTISGSGSVVAGR